MDVALLYFDGCPHWTVMAQRVDVALDQLGLENQVVRRVLVQTPEDAERLGFAGSPTILVDGADPFANGSERPGFACRVYRTPDGPAGSPTVDQLVAVLLDASH